MPSTSGASEPGFALTLWRSSIAGVCALVIGSVAIGIGVVCRGAIVTGHPSSFMDGISLVSFYAFFSILLGGLPVLLFGVPAHAGLAYVRRASYALVAILGAIPGVAMLLGRSGPGEIFLYSGVPIAMLMHYLFQRWFGRRDAGAPLRATGMGIPSGSTVAE